MKLPFDFEIIDKKIIVELDGPQHFKTVKLWGESEIIMQNDVFKMKKALEKGYTIIRILQTDVLHSRYDWQRTLLESIETVFSTPGCVYHCKMGEYEEHVKKMNSDDIKYTQVKPTLKRKNPPGEETEP
jgi:hypothetical protein